MIDLARQVETRIAPRKHAHLRLAAGQITGGGAQAWTLVEGVGHFTNAQVDVVRVVVGSNRIGARQACRQPFGQLLQTQLTWCAEILEHIQHILAVEVGFKLFAAADFQQALKGFMLAGLGQIAQQRFAELPQFLMQFSLARSEPAKQGVIAATIAAGGI